MHEGLPHTFRTRQYYHISRPQSIYNLSLAVRSPAREGFPDVSHIESVLGVNLRLF